MYPAVEQVGLTYGGQQACRGVPACSAMTGNRGLLKAIGDKTTGGIELQNSAGVCLEAGMESLFSSLISPGGTQYGKESRFYVGRMAADPQHATGCISLSRACQPQQSVGTCARDDRFYKRDRRSAQIEQRE